MVRSAALAIGRSLQPRPLAAWVWRHRLPASSLRPHTSRHCAARAAAQRPATTRLQQQIQLAGARWRRRLRRPRQRRRRRCGRRQQPRQGRRRGRDRQRHAAHGHGAGHGAPARHGDRWAWRHGVAGWCTVSLDPGNASPVLQASHCGTLLLALRPRRTSRRAAPPLPCRVHGGWVAQGGAGAQGGHCCGGADARGAGAGCGQRYWRERGRAGEGGGREGRRLHAAPPCLWSPHRRPPSRPPALAHRHGIPAQQVAGPLRRQGGGQRGGSCRPWPGGPLPARRGQDPTPHPSPPSPFLPFPPCSPPTCCWDTATAAPCARWGVMAAHRSRALAACRGHQGGSRLLPLLPLLPCWPAAPRSPTLGSASRSWRPVRGPGAW